MHVSIITALLSAIAVALPLCAAQDPGVAIQPFPRGRSENLRRRPQRVPVDGVALAPPNGEIFFPGLTMGTVGNSISTADGENFDSGDLAAYDNDTIELPSDFNLEELDLDSLRSLSEISSLEEFIRVMGLEPPPEDEPFEISLRRSGPKPVTAVSASCTPENVTVRLRVPRNDGNLYFPSCVRLPRCGGCCASRQLECVATTTATHNFKVLSIAPSSGNARRSMPRGDSRRTRRPSSRSRTTRRRKRQVTNYYYVDAQEHLTCGCLCRVQSTDCDASMQDYDPTNCVCKCRNVEEKSKCERSSAHYWQAKSCKCLCNKEQSCSTGQFFDHASCSCRNN